MEQRLINLVQPAYGKPQPTRYPLRNRIDNFYPLIAKKDLRDDVYQQRIRLDDRGTHETR